MPIDLNEIEQPRQQWLVMGGNLEGVEFLLKASTPRDSERFRQRLVRQGVLRSGKNVDGFQISQGREDDFFRMFAEEYVLDWKGATSGGAPADFNVEQMGKLLGQRSIVFERISEAISQDTDFFVSSNGG